MLSRLRAFFARGRSRPPPTIAVGADDFVVCEADGTSVEVRWAGVRRVVAFKRDLYTTDAIVLLFELDPPAPALLQLSEEWPGFADLFGAMERALGVSPAWYLEVMTPAFEPTPRTLYERPNSTA